MIDSVIHSFEEEPGKWVFGPHVLQGPNCVGIWTANGTSMLSFYPEKYPSLNLCEKLRLAKAIRKLKKRQLEIGLKGE